MNEEQRDAMPAAAAAGARGGDWRRGCGVWLEGERWSGRGLWSWVNFWVFIGFVSVELQQNILSSLESAGRECVCVCACVGVCVAVAMWASVCGRVRGRGKLTYQLRAQKKS